MLHRYWASLSVPAIAHLSQSAVTTLQCTYPETIACSAGYHRKHHVQKRSEIPVELVQWTKESRVEKASKFELDAEGVWICNTVEK